MSNYTAPAIHPETGVIQDALWIDDYYGPHRYGVRFDDGKVFDAWLVKLAKPPLTDCLRRVIEEEPTG